MKKIFVILAIFLLSGKLFSQIDNQFWFVAPDLSQTHGDNPIFIRLSSMSDPVNFVLTMPADASFIPITGNIGPNTTFTIPLTAFQSQIENSPPDRINTCGILLTTDNLVTAYYEEANSSNPGIFSLKGQNALGLQFYIISQNSYPNFAYSDDFESFEIVATEDNTLITITPTDDVTGYSANTPIDITLDRGETYSVRAIHQGAANTLAGSHIVSNKPVAVTWADDSVQTGGWDVIGDQLIPVTIAGSEYIAIKGYANNTPGDNEEQVFILGITNNTTVNIDGVFYQTISTGELCTYPFPATSSTAYIQTSDPVYVMHLSGYPGECGASLLPQVFCTGSRQIGFFRTSNNSFSLMVLTLDGNQGAFKMDGDPLVIQASDFQPVSGTGGQWVYTRKSFSAAQLSAGASHLLTNDNGKFHLGIINMLGGSAEYGYFSYFSSINLGVDQTICPGSSATINGGEGWTTYLWEEEIGGIWTMIGGNTQNLTVSVAGHYRCSVTGQNCTLQDDINIYMHPLLEPEITGDASVCINEINVPYNTTANFSAYDWSVTEGTISGQGTSSVTINWATTGSQTISLSCVNQYGCAVQQSLPVTVNPLPPVSLALPAVCSNMPAYPLEGGTPAGGIYAGTGVSNGVFDPIANGAGIVPITYTFTSPDGCVDMATANLTVNAATVVTMNILNPACISTPSVDLTGYCNPSSGQFSGTGVTGAGIFSPSLAPGGSQITYSYTDANSCTSSAQQFQQVIPLPTAQGTISGNSVLCQADQGVAYTLQNPDPLGTSFLWTVLPGSAGNAVGTGQTCVVNWSESFSGPVQLKFITSGDCGNSGFSIPFNILINPLPIVNLTTCIDLKTTKSGKPIILKGGLPLGAEGVYEGTGVSESPPGTGNYLFNPASNEVIPASGGAPYTITYRYTNTYGCDATAGEVIRVYPAGNQPCQTAMFTDIRDGQSYPTFLAGTGSSAKCWMAKNLNFGTVISGMVSQRDNCVAEKHCPDGNALQCDESGGAYQWDELLAYNTAEGVQGLCPPEWHVPSKTEWDNLVGEYQGEALAGGFFKTTGTAPGFNGLTAGINYFGQSWSFMDGVVKGSMFWTTHPGSDATALAYGLNSATPSISSYLSSRANALFVRCVRDW